MKLSRIKIEQVRQFRQPFELTGLEPGLNLFTGPNEAGKSTVVRAIRAAFFERHRSSSGEDLVPHGETAAAPTIELDFQIGGQAYQLRKTFLHRKRCTLNVGAQPLDGEEAELHLAQLLGFEFSSRGASKPEHWGVPGLLWIEQGGSQEIHAAVGHATPHLRKALDQSVSEVASTQGDEVIARVRAERDALLTAGGKPRSGVYAEVIAERSHLAEQLAQLDQRIASYRQQVDQLAALREEHAADQRSKPWEHFRTQLQAVQERLAGLQDLNAQLATDQASLRQQQDQRQWLEEQLQAFEGQQQALQQRQAELAAAEERVLSAAAVQARRALAQQQADAHYQAASDAARRSQQEDLRRELARRCADAQERIGALTAAIQRAEAEQTQLHACRALATETELSDADLQRLRAQHAQLRELRIRQETASTRVRFALSGPGVTLAGEALTGEGQRLIAAATELALPGLGCMTIIPGGTDLAELAREEAEQRHAHLGLLQRVGVATLDEAEARHARHRQASADRQQAEKALRHLAPQGLDALRAEHAEHQARRADAQAQQAQLPAAPTAPTAATPPLADSQLHLDAARAALDQRIAEAAQAQTVLSTAQAQRDSARREHDALQQLMRHPEQAHKRAEAARRLVDVRAANDHLTTRIAAQQAQIAAAQPDLLAQDVERLQRSATQTERVFHERESSLTLLRGKLEQAGAQGLEEERAELAMRAEGTERRHRELKLRADALSLLHDLLDAKRRELTKRLQAPLQKHIQHYLQLLFPGATLDIGEDLAPGRLSRTSAASPVSPFDALSYGAREQMGVISRLAYADLLKEAGRPTLIILDDALVHSDAQRLEPMKRVLFDASQRHQVLLFTCHPDQWRDLGAKPQRIGVMPSA